jgi:hypothetical protein
MLSHGWASSLYLFSLWGWRHRVKVHRASRHAGRAGGRAHDPANVFGYWLYQPAGDLYLDLPGLLKGASGIALALHAYATNRPPANEWATVLLLR